MKNLTVREFFPADNAHDKDALLPAFLEIWNEVESLKYLSFTLKSFDQEVVRIWIENHKEPGGRYFCAVNEDNKIIGIAVIKVSSVDGFEIYGLGVRPRFKRQGIGRKLMEHTSRLAVELEFKAVDISVFADNRAMLTASLSQGFIPVGMDYNKRADGVDIVHMKKYL